MNNFEEIEEGWVLRSKRNHGYYGDNALGYVTLADSIRTATIFESPEEGTICFNRVYDHDLDENYEFLKVKRTIKVEYL